MRLSVGDFDGSRSPARRPAAPSAYFEELSGAISADTATDARLDEIARAASMEIVGPVPDGYI